MMVGLDAAGKTTVLYQLKLQEVLMTIPTIGAAWRGAVESLGRWLSLPLSPGFIRAVRLVRLFRIFKRLNFKGFEFDSGAGGWQHIQ